MKALAIFIWVILVVFIAVILWPMEVPNLKVLWGSTRAVVDGFVGGDVGDLTEPPLWFLMAGMAILAAIYTVPGLTFIFAKSKVAYIHEMWRLRKEAEKLIDESSRTGGMADDGRNAIEIADHFSDKLICESAAKSVVISAIQAYEKAVHGRREAAQAKLSGVVVIPNKERNECLQTIKACDALLRSVTSITV